MATLFFSYSHRDEALRNELEVHLSMLKRQGILETWHDRRIVAGEEFNKAISKNLEEANIILLLVSPDFLNSDTNLNNVSSRLSRGWSDELRIRYFQLYLFHPSLSRTHVN